ncbi:MAG: cyclase family protein, partial [Spirochaetales bacterium]|nr:cyclase family protein [Spirochaetales bacterium]
MQTVYELNGLRVIDLTKYIDPATETRRCKLDRFNTGGAIPDFHTNVDIMTHLGTHCECPYHHFEDGASVADLPLTSFMGRGIYYEF